MPTLDFGVSSLSGNVIVLFLLTTEALKDLKDTALFIKANHWLYK